MNPTSEPTKKKDPNHKPSQVGRLPSHKGSIKGKVAVIFLKFLGALPLSLSQRIGFVIGRAMFILNLKEVRVARRNLQLCFPLLSTSERQSLLKESFENSGMLACEIAHIWTVSKDKPLSYIKSVDGEEALQAAIAKGKGVLVILPHLGNWEMLNPYLVQKLKLMAMYSPAQLKEVDDFMRERRAKTGLDLAEANKKGVLKLISELRSGGNLVILPDQEPARANGEFAPFFGREALTMTLISKMLMKTGATPVLAYVKRLGIGNGFEVVFRPVPIGVSEPDIRSSLTVLNQSVENAIREVPSQYMWGYKRFKRRPDGEQKIYSGL